MTRFLTLRERHALQFCRQEKKEESLLRLHLSEWVSPLLMQCSKKCFTSFLRPPPSSQNKQISFGLLQRSMERLHLYIIGPRISGVLVAGSVLAWWAIIPLLATLVPFEQVAHQLVTLGYLKDITV